MRVSSILCTVGALAGTILPMVLITLLGVIWVVQGKTMQIQFDRHHFFPQESQTNNLAFLTNVLFGLLGLEMAATHADEMRNPKRDYPRSIFIAAIIILSTIVFASLAIAIVVPKEELSLAAGIMQAFKAFLGAYQLSWLLPFIAIFIILGGLSGVGAWIIGPTTGLLIASQDGTLPKFFGKTNQKDVPVRILITQAIIVSFLSLIFILMPTVNSTYWILSVITAQLALLVYVAMFAAAIKLHYHQPHIERTFRIPGKKTGIWISCGVGGTTCLAVILLGFLPPNQVPFQSVIFYEFILIASMAICCLMPLYFLKKK
jgi:glutamate:GABA antiporter